MEETDDLLAIPEEVEQALLRQDQALMLLARLRAAEPYLRPARDASGSRRREFRRWPLPEGVQIELHDGQRWRRAECLDLGPGGARLLSLPAWMEGPVPARLTTPTTPSVIVLADTMWKEAATGHAGIRFEFQDDEEREVWSGGLIDALLVRHAVS